MRVANSPIVAFVLTCFICPTSDGTFVVGELDSAVLKVEVGDGSCLVGLGASPPVGVTATNRPLHASVGTGVAREPEVLSAESGLMTEVAAAQPENDERTEESREAAGIWGVKSGA